MTRAVPTLMHLHAAFSGLASECGASLPSLRVVVTDFLPAAIREVAGQEEFTGERLGGFVAGKTITDDPGWTAATVYVPDALWPEESGDSITPLSVVCVAHEFAHSLLGHIRGGEPADDGGDVHELAKFGRTIPQYAVDEVRADLVADAAVRSTMSITGEDGQTRPVTTVDVMGGGRTDDLVPLLNTVVHPGWPDTVDTYRNHGLGLIEMYQQLITEADQVFNAIAHAHAEAQIADAAPPMEALKSLRAVEIFVGPVWSDSLAALGDLPVIGSRQEMHEADLALAAAGRTALLEMWEKLGLSAEVIDDGMYLHVTEPIR